MSFLLNTNVVSEWVKPRPDPGIITWLAEVDEDRILPVDVSVADTWGQVVARSNAVGRTLGIMDGFLAATAEAHGLTMVTRNVADFSILGPSVFNPWTVS